MTQMGPPVRAVDARTDRRPDDHTDVQSTVSRRVLSGRDVLVAFECTSL